MDSKKIIEKLIKIAENQQKIIMKLAQAQGLPPDALPTGGSTFGGGHEMPTATQPPPQHLEPSGTQKNPEAVFYGAMTPAQRGLLAAAPVTRDNQMQIRFKPGQATQPNYDGLLKLLQNLTNQNKIQQAYQLKVV